MVLGASAGHVAISLLVGAAVGLVVIAAARWRPSLTRLVFGGGLIGAALIYVGFAIFGAHSRGWLGIESLGVAAYAIFGILGLRGSAAWLAAGWALHPVWDVALHLLGPGHGVVPDWYALACLSTDVLVAADILVRGVPAVGASQSAPPLAGGPAGP